MMEMVFKNLNQKLNASVTHCEEKAPMSPYESSDIALIHFIRGESA